MDLRQLRTFVAVAEAGSFTRAARAAAVSQPALSVQLGKLEAELGGRLFERGRRGARLTTLGEALLPRAQAALDQLERGRQELRELTGLTRGRVTLGCPPTTGAHVLPPVLVRFRARHPGVQVLLREESSPALADHLERGDVDLAILDDAGLRPDLAAERLFQEDLLLALPPRHPLARARQLTLARVAEEPVILMKPGHGFRQIALAAFQQAGVRPQIVFESGGIETVQTLVAAGLGISLVPRMVVRRDGGPAYVPLAPPRPSRTLYVAWRPRAALGPAARALRDVVMERLRPRGRPGRARGRRDAGEG